MLPKQLYTWYGGLHERLQPLNNSKFFAGLIVVLLNLAVKLVDVKLSKPMQSFFKNSFSRQALLFAMIWMPTRDVLAALIISTVVIFSIDCLMNDESALCVLPPSFTHHHRKLLEVEAMTSGAGGEKKDEGGGGAATADGGGGTSPDALQKDIDAAIRALEHARATLRRQADVVLAISTAPAGGGGTAAKPVALMAASSTIDHNTWSSSMT